MALRPAAVRDEPLITPVPKQHPPQTNNPNTIINPPVDDPSNDGDPTMETEVISLQRTVEKPI
jgi:hypothetical protein